MPTKYLPLLSVLLFAVATISGGCGGKDSVCDEVEGSFCPECAGELTRCEFDGVEVTERSCDGCQARLAVLMELCASGSEATAAEVEAGMTCEAVEDTDAQSP